MQLSEPLSTASNKLCSNAYRQPRCMAHVSGLNVMHLSCGPELVCHGVSEGAWSFEKAGHGKREVPRLKF